MLIILGTVSLPHLVSCKAWGIIHGVPFAHHNITGIQLEGCNNENVESIQKIVFLVIFLFIVPCILNWQLYQMTFLVLYVVKIDRQLLCYYIMNANVVGIWYVWRHLFRLCLQEIEFALVIASLLTMSHLPTIVENFLTVCYMFWYPCCISLHRHNLQVQDLTFV